MKLKEIRLKNNLTQEEVSQKLGLTQYTYSNYESGKTEPKLNILKKIANFFDVTIDYLLETSNTKNETITERNILNLKKYQKESGKTIKEVSQELNIPFSTYNNYLIGNREPNIETIIKLAKYFNVSTDELLGLSQAETNETVLTNKIKLLNEEERFKLNVFADALLSLREHEEKNK